MNLAVLTDFGSTVCKVTVVDLEHATVAGHGEAPTYLGDDVMDAYDAAFDSAVTAIPGKFSVGLRMSSSSAGGGLQIAAVGLVGEMTAAAAHRAALNAGGRIQLVLDGSLEAADVARLDLADPDIVLFSGGTDGGQQDLVRRNAEVLAAGSWTGQVVVACNKDVAADVARLLRTSGRHTHVVDNVMPRIGEFDAPGARAAILEIFLDHVIRGKNLSDRKDFFESMVTATPDAVLSATRLLACGTSDTPGIGDVVVVDVGGATTDVHSVSIDAPVTRGRRVPLLPLPQESRTVNGDLGMRSGSRGAVEVDGSWLTRSAGLSAEQWGDEARRRVDEPAWLAVTAQDHRLEELLGITCVSQALMRHCGRQRWIYCKDADPMLEVSGLDLSDVSAVIGTGGVLVHHDQPEDILESALSRAAEVTMSPTSPRMLVDAGYVLAAAGLLSNADADLALRVLHGALTEKADATPATSRRVQN